MQELIRGAVSDGRTVRDLLVLGHPRSGTGFISQYLTALGLPVGHERMQDRGVSSWMFAADADAVPYTFDGTVPTQFAFRHIVHVVRSPEKVIASMAFASLPDARTTNYMSRFITINRQGSVIEQAVQTYLGWNKLIMARRPDLRVKVEEAAEILPAVLGDWELLDAATSAEEIVMPPTNYNARQHRELTWQDIRNAIPEALYAELVEFAEELGYVPEETQLETKAAEAKQATFTASPAVRTKSRANSKCIILVPTYDKIEPATEKLLREFEARGYAVRRAFGNAAIDQARCRMATDALAEGYEELLWFDSDMTFPADALETLRQHQLPIVGVIAAKKGQRALNCEFMPGTKSLVFGTGGGLLELKYLGTGLLLTRREVYRTMELKLELPTCNHGRGLPIVPYFLPMLVPDGDGQWYLGEDYAFSERARRCGFKIFADTTIRVNHLGTYRYSWEDAGSEVKRFASYTYTLT